MSDNKSGEIEDHEKDEGTEESIPVEESTDLSEEIEVDAVAALQEQLNEKDLKIKELETEVLRVQADTQNYKRRLDKEKADMRKYGSERILKELLNIQDNFERALSSSNITVESLKEGVEMIQREMTKLFEKENVTLLKAVGKPFDPTIHEVLSQIASKDHKENTVIQEHVKGYKLHDRILRPSQVVIAKAPEENEDDANE